MALTSHSWPMWSFCIKLWHNSDLYLYGYVCLREGHRRISEPCYFGLCELGIWQHSRKRHFPGYLGQALGLSQVERSRGGGGHSDGRKGGSKLSRHCSSPVLGQLPSSGYPKCSKAGHWCVNLSRQIPFQTSCDVQTCLFPAFLPESLSQ